MSWVSVVGTEVESHRGRIDAATEKSQLSVVGEQGPYAYTYARNVKRFCARLRLAMVATCDEHELTCSAIET